MKRIAIDFDSTLADTRVVAYQLMFGDDHDRDPTESTTWDWPIEMFGAARFLSAMWHTWTLRPLDAPPTEPYLAETINDLREQFEVHIVTAHPNHMGVTDGKKEWLDYHGIEVDEFVVVTPDVTKAEMDYYAFVDDKTALPHRVNQLNPESLVYLIDWPYNRDAPGDYIRVENVKGAAYNLLTREVTA